MYVETSVVSYLISRDSKVTGLLSKQQSTRLWWNEERAKFDIFVSEIVIEEAKRGNAKFAAERLEALSGIEMLAVNNATVELAELLITQKAVPKTASEDAAHIALATAHGMDFLLTWNFRHINNAARKRHIEKVCASAGFAAPMICTPEELMEINDVQ